MDLQFARQQIVLWMRARNESVEDAAASLARGYRIPVDAFMPAVAAIRKDGGRNALLDGPLGVRDTGVEEEARLAGWYTGVEEGDTFWPRLRDRLLAGGMRDAVDDIDRASTKVVANLADPSLPGLKKRGLVLGYVQSGKTANFTAVMAKAADAGYSLFIVLSGLHNNLRRQTQVRLDQDLLDEDWHKLTDSTSDFAYRVSGSALLKQRVKVLAVVKKNQARLRNLRDWLRDMPEEIRRRVPVLLLDDEADQATPNSAVAADERSRINQLVRQIWGEIPTGTYLGYTATPFANVFMDPTDEEELYPADFIIDLPRPETYFGAERIFGREPIGDADDPDPGLNMIRTIPDWEADAIRPPGAKAKRASFDPALPESLEDAIIWFLVATAVRRARGEASQHSSMLIHTTHFVDPHFAMRDRVTAFLHALRADVRAGRLQVLRDSFDDEASKAASAATQALPAWGEVQKHLGRVLDEVKVVVDNGLSEDRLDYDRRDENGQTTPETVIAVGGGTLSRGLTLEGLVVSYFTRTSNTYDTLLQMGRWFGFRPGYEDLPRMWLQESLEEDFRFLALVEEEIRRDMRDMERRGVTPRQFGVRVRAHPGRLEIVARTKMQHADVVSITYSGTRLQTIWFNERDSAVISANQGAASRFIGAALKQAPAHRIPDRARWLIRGVPTQVVIGLLQEYQFHPKQLALDAADMIGWISSAVPERLWNVVVAGSERRYWLSDGSILQLGDVDLGLPERIPTVNRAPLNSTDHDAANIKALLSKDDWFADISASEFESLDEARQDPRRARREHAEGRGLVIVMPVSKNSVSLRGEATESRRRRMVAPDHLIGLGIIFPETEVGDRSSGRYYSVHPDWEPEAPEEDDLPEDLEGDFEGARP